MMKYPCVVISFVLILLLGACGAPAAAPNTSNRGATESAPTMNMSSTMPMNGTMTSEHGMGGMAMGSGAPVPTVTPGVPANIPAATPDLAAFPVTIHNCGRTLTFRKPPERVVALYPLTAEFLLRLGLGDRIIGAAFTQADPVAPDLVAAFQKLPVLTTDSAPSKEVLLTARPDFVIDNFPGLFYAESRGMASIDQLAANGAQAYTLTARCEGNEVNGKVEDLYTDIGNLGKIFGVGDRATQLIDALRGRVAAVQAKIAGKPPVRVMIYDSGVGPINVFGTGAIANVVEHAGGHNEFADASTNREFLMLSAEEVASRDPDVFVLLERYGSRMMSMGKDLTTQEAADFLIKTFPNTAAAKNKRVVIVPYQQLYTGLLTIDGIETLAKAFYPEASK
jgi:iron complex transport system substrate-binding protein